MTTMNFNLPDDGYSGMMTSGVYDEETHVLSMSKTCFEYMVSQLIRKAHLDDFIYRLYAYRNGLRCPEECYDAEHVAEGWHEVMEAIELVPSSYDDLFTEVLEEFNDKLIELWEQVSENPNIDGFYIGNYTRILFHNTATEESDDLNVFEIIAFSKEEIGQFYHANWAWDNNGFTVIE